MLHLDPTNPYETPDFGTPERADSLDRGSQLFKTRQERLGNQPPLLPHEWAGEEPTLGEVLFPDMVRAEKRKAAAQRQASAVPSVPSTPQAPLESFANRGARKQSAAPTAPTGVFELPDTPLSPAEITENARASSAPRDLPDRSPPKHPGPTGRTTPPQQSYGALAAAEPVQRIQATPEKPDTAQIPQGQQSAAPTTASPKPDSALRKVNNFGPPVVHVYPSDRPSYTPDILSRMFIRDDSPSWEAIRTDAENRAEQPLTMGQLGALEYFVANVDRFEEAGDVNAAFFLRHYLGGSGQPLQIPDALMGPDSNIARGIASNYGWIIDRTARAHQELRDDIRDGLRNLQDGETFTFTDIWNNDFQGDDALARGNTDEHNTIGDGGVDSTYAATATRTGNTITLSGTMRHFPDPDDKGYDFPGLLPMSRSLEAAGIARPFNMEFEKYGAFYIVIEVTPGPDGEEFNVVSDHYREITAEEFEVFF